MAKYIITYKPLRGTFSDNLIKAIFERGKNKMKCYICKRTVSQLSKHHIIPRSKRVKIKKSQTIFRKKLVKYCCADCHKTIHQLFTNPELREFYRHGLHEIDEAFFASPIVPEPKKQKLENYLKWVEDKPEGVVKNVKNLGGFHK